MTFTGEDSLFAVGTEEVEIEGASHGLTIESTWRKACDTALEFVKRFV